MKISELTTDQAADVLCELTPYVANIVGDKTLIDELGKKFDVKGKSAAELYLFAAQKYALLIPIFLKEHRDDVFGILSVLEETDKEKIAAQNFLDTIAQMREVLQDKDLLNFFRSWGQEEKTA